MAFRIKDGFTVDTTNIVNSSGQLLVYQKDTTTIGQNLSKIADGTTIRFIRINDDETVDALGAADFRTAIGAGTSSTTGTVTSVSGTGTVSGLTLSGTVTTSGNLTLGGTLSITGSAFGSQTANTVLAAPNGSAGNPSFRALVAADIPTLNQDTTGSAGSVTNSVTFNNGGSGDASGTTYNGSAAKTISYNTVGAAAASHTHSYLPLSGGTITGDLTVNQKILLTGNRNIDDNTGNGFIVQSTGSTYTYTGAAGTKPLMMGSFYAAPQIASTNAITVTDAATIYINAAPQAGANVTITNSWALLVDGGNSRFDNDVTINGTLNVRTAIDLADSNILRFGTGDDWEFFHNGTHNYMDLNVGDLYIRDGTTDRFIFGRTTGNLTITGDLIVNGTTTTVNSETVTLQDPILRLGGSAPSVEITKDRGIENLWNGTLLTITNVIANGTTTITVTVASTSGYQPGDLLQVNGASGTEQGKFNGTWKINTIPNSTTFTVVLSSTVAAATYTANLGAWIKSKVAFFGLDQSTGKFTFIPQANNTSEVFSGTAGTFVGSFEGNATTATTLETSRTITIGNTGKSFDGSQNVSWTLSEIGAAATNQTFYLGTTQIAINRASGSQNLTGINAIYANTSSNLTITGGGEDTILSSIAAGAGLLLYGGFATGYGIESITSLTGGKTLLSGGNTGVGATSLNSVHYGGDVIIKGGSVTSATTTSSAKEGGDVIIEGGGFASGGNNNSNGSIYIGNSSFTDLSPLVSDKIGTKEVVIGKSGTPVKLPGVGTSGFVKLGTGGELSADTNTYALSSHTHSYLPLSGGTLTGELKLGDGNTTELVNLSAQLATTVTATSATAVDTWAAATYRSCEYLVQVTQSTSTAEYYTSKIMITHDGTTTYMTEYAVIETGTIPVTFTTDISGVNVRLIATITDANTRNAVIKLHRTLITV